MTKTSEEKSVSLSAKRKRAFCENEQKFVGDWHDDEDAVYDDIDAHRAEPKNKNHIVRLVVEN